jgi:hypothetical protein
MTALVTSACAHSRPRDRWIAGSCEGDRAIVLGACVTSQEARDWCDAGEEWNRAIGACAARECDSNHVLDHISGECISLEKIRAIATREHIGLGDDETLGCADDFDFAIENADPICVGRGNHRAHRVCGSGEIADENENACVRVVASGVIDVARWMRVAFGKAGGVGTRALCERLGHDPQIFGGDVEAIVPIDVRLTLPDNDARDAFAHAAIDAASSGAGSDVARDHLDHAIAPFIDALRALGGSDRASSAADASTRVTCTVEPPTSPIAVRIANSPRISHPSPPQNGSDAPGSHR